MYSFRYSNQPWSISVAHLAYVQSVMAVVWYQKSDICTAQKMKFFVKDFFGKCNQIRRKLQVWSYLLKKSLIENFIFMQP